jgi:proteasome accessory factor B
MEKAERLLDLVALLLDAREPVSFAELRDLFPEDYGGNREAAERKLERDKSELLELGVPLEYVDPDRLDERDLGGYRIDRKSYFLPDPRLLPEESAALYAAGAAALAARDFPFAQDLQHALRKISLAGDTSAVGGAAARRLLVVRPGDPQRAGKLRDLGEAVARRKRIHIAYQSPQGLEGRAGARTEREVDPWGLAFRGGAWRLVGFCHLRHAQRVFVVDRIESLSINPQKPQTADFEPPADFDAGAEAGRSSRPWQWSHHAPQEVALRFAKGSEAIGARLFDAPEGRLTVTNLDGLVPQILSLGDRVWIDSPAAAREKVRSALRRIAQRLEPAVEPPPEPIALPASEARPAPAPDAQEGRRERLRRLLLIVPAARRRPGVRLPDLARELGLDAEELREDIDLLGLVGRPPFSPDDLIDISVDERDRVFVALDQSFSRPPQLTAVEALALAAAAQEAAPADPAVTSAIAKLRENLTPRARDLYARLARRVAVETPAPRGSGAVLAGLRAAAQRHQEVSLEYDKDGRGAAGERIFHPQGVIDHGGVWYVIGHDAGRGAERTFRVDRILSVRETGRVFPDPGPLDPARFQREKLFFPSGREEAVILRFSAAAASWALQRYGARARPLADGRVDVSIESAGPGYAVQLALSLAGEAEIAAPTHAREALRDEVARALRLPEEA